MRTVLALLLAAALAAPASAGPIARGAEKQTKEAAQSAGKTGTRSRFFWPGIVLIGGGAAVALVGFVRETPRPGGPMIVNGQPLVGNPYLQETLIIAMPTGHNAALGIAGLGIAGAGATLLIVGHKRQRQLPTVSFRPGAVTVTRSFRF